MIFKLFSKELKYQFKSITYYVFLFVILLFYFTQFDADYTIVPPQPNQESYGFTEETDPFKEMAKIYRHLQYDLDNGKIAKYAPFYKEVNLSDNEKEQINLWLGEMVPSGKLAVEGDIKITYEHYLEIMEDLDKMLGGNTVYGSQYRRVSRPLTYEEALNNYNDILNHDKITNAFARLFSDYMGITAGLFPIFIAAFVLLRDRKTRAHELIFSSHVSSLQYIVSKYLAVCFSVMMGYLLLATYATINSASFASTHNYTIDLFAFYKYTLTWIMPTVLFTVAIGFVTSVLFNNAIVGILLQAVIAYQSLMPLQGDYSLTKNIIRFNTAGDYSLYMSWRDDIIINRLFFTLLSFALIGLTIYIWSRKRKKITR